MIEEREHAMALIFEDEDPIAGFFVGDCESPFEELRMAAQEALVHAKL